MKNIILLTTLLFLVISCNKDYETINIDSDILVSTEKLDNTILLTAETERNYATLGHQITFCDKVKKKEVYIEFKKVKVPEVGLTALGPATSSINLGSIENGEYAVTFELNGKKTKGKLIIGNSAELNIDSGSNVKLH